MLPGIISSEIVSELLINEMKSFDDLFECKRKQNVTPMTSGQTTVPLH